MNDVGFRGVGAYLFRVLWEIEYCVSHDRCFRAEMKTTRAYSI